MKPTASRLLARLRQADGGWVEPTHPGLLMARTTAPSAATINRWRNGQSYTTALGYLLGRIEVKESGCWGWRQGLNHHGYGTVRHWQFGDGLAHRFSWFVFHGRVPIGLTLDHLCRVRACVNPDHLEAVTMAENLRRSPLLNRSHCTRGHAYTSANTIQRKRGGRECRICVRRLWREAAARRDGRAA